MAGRCGGRCNGSNKDVRLERVKKVKTVKKAALTAGLQKKKKNRVHISVAMKKRDKILSRKDKQRHTRLK